MHDQQKYLDNACIGLKIHTTLPNPHACETIHAQPFEVDRRDIANPSLTTWIPARLGAPFKPANGSLQIHIAGYHASKQKYLSKQIYQHAQVHMAASTACIASTEKKACLLPIMVRICDLDKISDRSNVQVLAQVRWGQPLGENGT